jgi:hypothetical protein
MIIIGGILVLFMYITRLASNEIFLPSNKIYWEGGWAKDLSATRYNTSVITEFVIIVLCIFQILDRFLCVSYCATYWP